MTAPVWSSFVENPAWVNKNQSTNLISQSFTQSPPTPNYAAGQCALFTDTYWFVNTLVVTSLINATVVTTNVRNVTDIPCPRPIVTNVIALNTTRSFSWTLTAGTPVTNWTLGATGTVLVWWPVSVTAVVNVTNNATALTGTCTIRGLTNRTLSMTSAIASPVGGSCANLTCNGTAMNGINSFTLTGNSTAVCTYTCDSAVTSVSCVPTFSIASQSVPSLSSNVTTSLLNDTSACMKLLISPLWKTYATVAADKSDRTICAAGVTTGALYTPVNLNVSTSRGVPLATECATFGAANFTLVNTVQLNTITSNVTVIAPRSHSIWIPCPNASFTGVGSYVVTQNWTWCVAGTPRLAELQWVWSAGGGVQEAAATRMHTHARMQPSTQCACP